MMLPPGQIAIGFESKTNRGFLAFTNIVKISSCFSKMFRIHNLLVKFVYTASVCVN